MDNVSSCFQTASKTTLINISPSATTESEIADKAKLEFRRSEAPAEKLRYACISSGLSCLKSFLRKLRKNPQISLNDLWQFTQKLSAPLTDQDLDNLIEQYSKNGRLDVQRLSEDVQVPMNKNRQQLIEQIFNSISQKQQTSVDSNTLLRHFCFKNERDYVAGKVSEQQVVDKFKKDFNLEEHDDGGENGLGEVNFSAEFEEEKKFEEGGFD